MFDIDKMYLMFPTIKPQYDVNKKLKNYIFNQTENCFIHKKTKNKIKVGDNISVIILGAKYTKKSFRNNYFITYLFSSSLIRGLNNKESKT